MIAAVDLQGTIGRAGKMPWHLPADLSFFRNLTMGKTVIMGRRTYQSLPKKLDGRRLIVLSRQSDYQPAGVTVCRSIEEVLNCCPGEDELIVAGGASIYSQFIELARKLYLTVIQYRFDGDRYFPDLQPEAWDKELLISQPQGAENPWPFKIYLYRRKEF